MIEIRGEQPFDYDFIMDVHENAFGGRDEAQLVSNLRQADAYEDGMSLVALKDKMIVGHILFSYLRLANLKVAGLAPMAVMPGFQKQGIGSKLIKQGLENVKELGCQVVFVLGDPDYYRRFGFRREPATLINSAYSGENFMAIEFEAGTLVKIMNEELAYPLPFANLS